MVVLVIAFLVAAGGFFALARFWTHSTILAQCVLFISVSRKSEKKCFKSFYSLPSLLSLQFDCRYFKRATPSIAFFDVIS